MLNFPNQFPANLSPIKSSFCKIFLAHLADKFMSYGFFVNRYFFRRTFSTTASSWYKRSKIRPFYFPPILSKLSMDGILLNALRRNGSNSTRASCTSILLSQLTCDPWQDLSKTNSIIGADKISFQK